MQADARGGTNEFGALPGEFALWVLSKGTCSLRLLARALRTPGRPQMGARAPRLAGPGSGFGNYVRNRVSPGIRLGARFKRLQMKGPPMQKPITMNLSMPR